MPSFEIVCLANSRKHGGRCVAGLRANGVWVRPVSNYQDGTLYNQHYTLDSGAPIAVLDVVRMDVGQSRPVAH
jgi:hypothetical protein